MEINIESILDVTPDSIVVINTDGVINYINKQTESLFDYKKEELIGNKVELLIPERFRQIHPDHRADYFSSPHVRPMGSGLELFGRKKDGTEFLVEISLAPVKDKGGNKVIGAIASIRDVTERKAITEELKERTEDLKQTNLATLNLLEDLDTERKKAKEGETLAIVQNTQLQEALLVVEEEQRKAQRTSAKDEAILASIGDGLVVTDTNEKIVLVNHAFETLLEWTADEVQGKTLSDVVPLVKEDGTAISKAERLISKIIKEHTTTTTTTTAYYRRKNGTSFPVSNTISPIMIESKLIGAIEIFRDITKEKEIDKAKSEFVSLASHQLRTPLSTINWYSEMLLAGDAGKINKEQKKYLDEIYTGNQRMVELVNALLNVSRLELGTFMVEPKPTDIIELAKSVVSGEEPNVFKRKINLIEKYDKKMPKLNVDPKLLRMVFQNLISNAVKYTPEKGKIDFSIKKNKESVLITVADTGYGIPKKQQGEMFKKLFRADNIRALDTEGTGLGLYIVKSVVEHSGGKIWFESEENKGTTFYVELPLGGMEKKEGTKALS